MNLAGLILVSYGGRGVVELESGERLECKYRRSVGRPCCGDRVTVQHADDESTVVVAIEPRRNEFARADARQRRQIIAANLDRVLIVIAPAPLPSRDLVERYLVAVHSLGIEPVLVLNKADLLNGAASDRYTMFEIDRLRPVNISILGEKVVKVDAGEFDVIGIRHQAEGSKRATTLWCAAELGYLPVVIEQHRKGKLRVRATLTDYTPTEGN